MRNTFGNNVSMTVFGESHGDAVGVVIDGLSAGIEVDISFINKCLDKRRPQSLMDTSRQEKDEYEIISGVFNGKTTGAPITIIIPNKDTKSNDYTQNLGLARPSHADYTAHVKYDGYNDYRGGGHFSGRVTAGIVAGGAILISALNKLGIKIGTHIKSVGQILDREFCNYESDLDKLSSSVFPVLDEKAGEMMSSAILDAREKCDSVGGIVETAIVGLPIGLGEPYFDSVESQLSHALFSLGGIKGVEFGLGFNFNGTNASAVNDQFVMENGKIKTLSNNNGGINGGITNGMEVVFRCAVKPTPSILREQNTVNYLKGENASLTIKGRHDPAIIRRVCPVIDSISALVICDLIATNCGLQALKGTDK